MHTQAHIQPHYARTHACTHKLARTQANIRTHARTHACTSSHTHAHAHAHAHEHAHVRTSRGDQKSGERSDHSVACVQWRCACVVVGDGLVNTCDLEGAGVRGVERQRQKQRHRQKAWQPGERHTHFRFAKLFSGSGSSSIRYFAG
jgi:hypothetical protein